MSQKHIKYFYKLILDLIGFLLFILCIQEKFDLSSSHVFILFNLKIDLQELPWYYLKWEFAWFKLTMICV